MKSVCLKVTKFNNCGYKSAVYKKCLNKSDKIKKWYYKSDVSKKCLGKSDKDFLFFSIMDESLVLALIELTEVANKLPTGIDFELAQLEQPFSTKTDQLKKRTFNLASKLISFINKSAIIEDMDDLENASEATMTKILNELDLSNIEPKKQMQTVTQNKTEIKDVNGISFLYSTSVPKSPKFSPTIVVPETLNKIQNLPDFSNLADLQIDHQQRKFIDNLRDLQSAVVQLSKAPYIFLSCEIHRIRTYRPYPCILVIYAQDFGIFIIDIMKIRFNLEPLKELLENPNVIKIFYDSNLYSLLIESCGIFISPSIDLSLSYEGQTLNECIANLQITQDYSRRMITDWRIRPLTDFMQTNAVVGVIHLPKIIAMTQDIKIPDPPTPSFTPYSFTQELADSIFAGIISKYGDLDELSAAVLKNLISWRDSVAAIEDECPNFFVTDGQIYTIAINLPKTPKEVLECFGATIPHLVNTYRGDIVQMIKSTKDKLEGKDSLYNIKK